MAPANLDDLTRPQFGKPEATERFHVNENVWSTFATCQEPKSANAIEPFDHGPFPITLRRHDHVCALRQLRRMNGRRLIHTQNRERLIALRALQNLTVDARPLVVCLVSPGPETGDMQQHIPKTVIRNDKAEALAGIKPLDRPGDLENFEAGALRQSTNLF